MSLVVETQGLTKAYHQTSKTIEVLSGLDLKLEGGKSLAVTGSSGVGKSTLLNCLGLLDGFDHGQIYLDGQGVAGADEERKLRLRYEKIGFVFQFHYLMTELSALENVMLPLMVQQRSKKESKEIADLWLEKMGLANRVDHLPTELSGGEQQRVAIARALAREPRLILADEPTGNLDPKTAASVFELLQDRARELNAGLIVATHNMELAERLDESRMLLEGRLE